MNFSNNDFLFKEFNSKVSELVFLTQPSPSKNPRI